MPALFNCSLSSFVSLQLVFVMICFSSAVLYLVLFLFNFSLSNSVSGHTRQQPFHKQRFQTRIPPPPHFALNTNNAIQRCRLLSTNLFQALKKINDHDQFLELYQKIMEFLSYHKGFAIKLYQKIQNQDLY